MRNLISNSLSPNLTFIDALRAIFSCGSRDFSPYFGEKYLLANSARTLFGALTDQMQFDKSKSIAIPAFSCAVMATPFLARGYRIEWIDTDDRGVIDPTDFARKADQVSAVMVSHIFGQRPPLEDIIQIAKSKNIFVIEDCAHYFNTEPLTADVRIYSFGREKVYSCISGGAMIWQDQYNFNNISLPKAKFTWTLRHLLQLLTLGLALPVWHFGGKYFAALISKLGILPRAVTTSEKLGAEDFPQTQLPHILQRILFHQLQNQKQITTHRQKIYDTWAKILPYENLKVDYPLRYLVKVENRTELIQHSAKLGFDLKDWEGAPIAPGVALEHFGYTPGQCPHAEAFANSYLTFPTNIRTKESSVNLYQPLTKSR